MRNIVASLLMVAFVATSAFGGTVDFTASDPIETMTGGTAMFDVTLAVDTLDTFNAMTVVFEQADFGVAEGDFVFAQDFVDACAFPPFTAAVPEGLTAGGYLTAATASFMIGTLSIDVPAGTIPGEYYVQVDPNNVLNELTMGTTSEGLAGSGMITVVPEPATIALMGLGALGLLRRRR